MKLSAPIYRLKRQAKLLSRAEKIPLHSALDHIARGQGFGSWSLLASQNLAITPCNKTTRSSEGRRPGLVGRTPRPGQNHAEPGNNGCSDEKREQRLFLHS